MNYIAVSSEVNEQVKLRLASPARYLQIKKLSVGSSSMIDALSCAMRDGLITLNLPMVMTQFKHEDEEICMLFIGTIEQVLEKIKAIPLPREGKKGISRIVLVKMVARRIEDLARACKMANGEWIPTEETVYAIAHLKMYLSEAQIRDKVFEITRYKWTLGCGYCGWGVWTGKWEQLMHFFTRKEITQDILEEGFALWAARSVMET